MRRKKYPPVIDFDREPTPSEEDIGTDAGSEDDLYRDQIMDILRGSRFGKRANKGFNIYKGTEYRMFPVRTEDGGVHPYALLFDGKRTSFGWEGDEVSLSELTYTSDFGVEVVEIKYEIEGYIDKYAKV